MLLPFAVLEHLHVSMYHGFTIYRVNGPRCIVTHLDPSAQILKHKVLVVVSREVVYVVVVMG